MNMNPNIFFFVASQYFGSLKIFQEASQKQRIPFGTQRMRRGQGEDYYY